MRFNLQNRRLRIARFPAALVLGGVLFLGALPVGAATQKETAGGCLQARILEILQRANPFALDETTRAFKQVKKDSHVALGRNLKNEQIRAIQRANELGDPAEISAAEAARRSRLLREAGFSESDLEKLADKNLLKRNPSAAPVTILPEAAFSQNVRLAEFNRHAVRQLKTGEGELHYVVDVDNQIFILQGESGKTVPKEPLWIARDLASPDGRAVLVKETGTVRYADGQLKFTPMEGVDLSKSEIDSVFALAKKEHPDLKLTHAHAPRAAEARVLGCADIMSGQLAGRSFIKDNVVAGNLIMLGSMGAAELFGAGRLSTEHGVQVLGADIVGGNANMLINSVVSRSIVMSQLGMGRAIGTRAALGLVTTQVQDQIYKGMLPGEDAQERARALTAFNMAHFYLKLPLNQLIDRGLIQKLPVALFDVCRRGGIVKVVISTQSIRLMERSASTAAYFILRGIFVDEGNRPLEEGVVERMQNQLSLPLKTLGKED